MVRSPIRLVLVFGAAWCLTGCQSVPSETVYVDVQQVLTAERAPEMESLPLPTPPSAQPAVSVSQPGLPGTKTSDRTIERLQLAKKLIDENRGKSIEALSTMLKRVYLARAEDEIAKNNRDLQPDQDALVKAALEDVRIAFERYGAERGPLLARVSVLARNTDLADQKIPDDANPIDKMNWTEANKIRAQIRALDAEFQQEALALMAEASRKIEAEIAKLVEQAKQTRANASAQAIREAESKAAKTEAALNVRVKQLVPESLPAVPGRQVSIPGTSGLPPPPTNATKPIFGSLEERRHLIDQEIEIWVRTTGHKRSTTPSGGRDATEEFLRWRSAHKVGP